MTKIYALAGLPGALVLCAAVAVAVRGGGPDPGKPALDAGTDVGRTRVALMRAAPIGSPADVALAKLQDRGLSCKVTRPPLANLTWRVIQCSTPPSSSGASLLVDVAGRNGVVADIGVDDPSCASRADVITPNPEPGGCDLSGKRLLELQARGRAAEGAFLAEVLAAGGVSGPKSRR